MRSMSNCMYTLPVFIFVSFSPRYKKFFHFTRRIDDSHVNGSNGVLAEHAVSTTTSMDPVQSNADNQTLSAYSKRPVSMFEAREAPHTTKSVQIHDNRTANSMYQMIDGQTPITSETTENGTSTHNGNSSNSLPHSDEVKYRTEVVTRRIQELWSVMQEMSSNDAFVPGAERIRIAVAELTAIFPMVKCLKNQNFLLHNVH